MRNCESDKYLYENCQVLFLLLLLSCLGWFFFSILFFSQVKLSQAMPSKWKQIKFNWILFQCKKHQIQSFWFYDRMKWACNHQLASERVKEMEKSTLIDWILINFIGFMLLCHYMMQLLHRRCIKKKKK